MTPSKLRAHTAKDLARMARDRGVAGWHSMRKEELVRALVRHAKRKSSAKPRNGAGGVAASASGPADSQPRNAESLRKLSQLKRRMATIKNLAGEQEAPAKAGPAEDRLVVMVRGPYWLHAYWELCPRSIERAQAALGRRWHGAQPTLRVFRMSSDGSACVERDVAIHGGVRNWYIDVQEPPQDYRLEIGYLTEDQDFHCLARSNQVSTPPAGSSEALQNDWADVAAQADRIFAMSGGYSHDGASRELQEMMEERLQRPLGSPMATRYGSGASEANNAATMQFAVDAEMVVYGVADRGAHVTLQGEPVKLGADGSFTVRIDMPDRRQVVPVVASSSDGVEQQTIILAVERNTKVMETIVRDVTG